MDNEHKEISKYYNTLVYCTPITMVIALVGHTGIIAYVHVPKIRRPEKKWNKRTSRSVPPKVVYTGNDDITP